ncbi:MAG: hypothetical protein HY367_04475 [Candidatus Aenigmarchaeota archaeon]|nr:hypothetical protein [Candidatus Aenigmarchaeota archaeon]
MPGGTKQILKELREIRMDIKAIKQTMPDKDMFLTAEEERLVEESYMHQKKGELVSGRALRKELGI